MLGLAVQPIRDGPIPDPAGGDWPPAANPDDAAAANVAEPAEAAELAPHDLPAPAGEAGEPEVGLEDALVNGGDPAMLANDLNIPEFSTEESQLSEGMLWGYSSDPPSCTLWGDSVPAAGDGIESPPPPMPEASRMDLHLRFLASACWTIALGFLQRRLQCHPPTAMT